MRTHREIVISSFPHGKLLFEVIKRIEAVQSVELFVVLAVAAFHFAVMPRSIRSYEFVADAQFLQGLLKERKAVRTSGKEPVGKLCAVVRLHAFNEERELLHDMEKEHRRRVSIVFLKSFKVAEAAVFVDESVLIVLRSFFLSSNTALRNKFHVDLDALAWILHLFVRF